VLHVAFPFFHGKITRKACEELLCKNGKNGSYLIRESESVEGAFYCLCLLTNFIFLSLQTSEGIPEKVFRTLKDLIYNYEKPNQGLVTNLRYPVKKTRPLQRSRRLKLGKDDIYDGEKFSSVSVFLLR
uniref:SH2 domain-containing protein n=1 Tax=Anas zonorhyncha TaxID=75864 RepID=A0A8B9U3V5_9AVES